MTKRELVIDGKIRLRLPPAGLRVFDIAGADLVKLRLAHVVQQRTDGKALHAVAFLKKAVHHRFKHADAVHHQPMLTGTVIFGAGRRGKKIGLFKPFQQLFCTLAPDVGGEQLFKFLLIIQLFHRVILPKTAAPEVLLHCAGYYQTHYSTNRKKCKNDFALSGNFFRRLPVLFSSTKKQEKGSPLLLFFCLFLIEFSLPAVPSDQLLVDFIENTQFF